MVEATDRSQRDHERTEQAKNDKLNLLALSANSDSPSAKPSHSKAPLPSTLEFDSPYPTNDSSRLVDHLTSRQSQTDGGKSFPELNAKSLNDVIGGYNNALSDVSKGFEGSMQDKSHGSQSIEQGYMSAIQDISAGWMKALKDNSQDKSNHGGEHRSRGHHGHKHEGCHGDSSTASSTGTPGSTPGAPGDASTGSTSSASAAPGDASTGTISSVSGAPGDSSTGTISSVSAAPGDSSTGTISSISAAPGDSSTGTISSAPASTGTDGTISASSTPAGNDQSSVPVASTGGDQTVSTIAPASGGSQSNTGLDHVIAVHRGTAGSGDGAQGWTQALGKPVSDLDYLAENQPVNQQSWAIDGWAAWKKQNPDGTMIASVPLAQDGTSLTDTIKNVSQYQDLAKQMVAAGLGSSVIRLGWEANGNWYPWSAGNGNNQNYKDAYNAVAEAMKSVPGANFKFDWSINAGYSNGTKPDGSPLQLADWYPGNQNVDIIGIDAYDMPGRSVNQLFTMPEGINDITNFANQNNKQVAVPEWGIFSQEGDDTSYMQAMTNYFKNTPNLAYESYYDGPSGGVGTTLEQNPNSYNLFKDYASGTASE